jgi:flavin-dependent dehydrogenase
MGRKFDCIVIGSGLGGLTAGALCAKAGLKVLVLERNKQFGDAAAGRFPDHKAGLEAYFQRLWATLPKRLQPPSFMTLAWAGGFRTRLKL